MIPIDSKNAAEWAEKLLKLKAPFDPADVKLKPQTVKGNRALAIHYVDARTVMDRLDEVFGLGGWQASYHLIEGGVVCTLRVLVAGEWITHEDVGGASDQPDEGDRTKAAFSDALKRAAVHVGIGRYLYRMPQQWMDYDPVKKCIIRPGAAQQTPATAPAKSAQDRTVSVSAKEIAATLDAAKSRADGTAPWKRYEAAMSEGKVSAVDKAWIEEAFKRFGLRFPATTAAKS